MREGLQGRAANGLLRVFSVFFFCLFCVLWLSLCFFNNAVVFAYSLPLQLVSAAVAGGVLAVGAFGLQRLFLRGGALPRRRPVHTLLALLLVLLCLQCVVVANIATDIGWDVATLMVTATSEDTSAYSHYFSAYPNNLLLLVVYRYYLLLLTVLRVSAIWHAFAFLNVLAVDITIFLVCLAALRMFGRRTAFLAFGIQALVLGLSPWIIVPYSDTLSMPFIALFLYLYAGYRGTHSGRARVLRGIACGAALGVGYLVKPTSLVIGIAVCIVHLLCARGWRLRRDIPAALACLLAGSVVLAGFTFYIGRQNLIEITPGKQVPATSFYMLGLSEYELNAGTAYGAWNTEDIAYIMTGEDTAVLKETARVRIGQRLEQLGVGGYLRFLLNKARWVTSEGSFFWAGDGVFANYDNMGTNFLRNLFYPVGRFYPLWMYWAQGLWIVVLGLCSVPVFARRGDYKSRPVTLLRVAIFGILLFVMLFEGRPRYLLNYVPLFSLLAAYGLGNAMQWQWRKNRNN